jgi:hypothetical protein
VSNLNKTITEKQQTNLDNLENAKRWLRRAQMDFNAFKRIVPFDRKSRKPVRCTDPALAVYLLQQTIEKATKAVAAATGKYSDRRLRSHSHNSLGVLLSFYRGIIATIIKKRPEFGVIAAGLGLDLKEGLDKIIDITAEVEKTHKKQRAGEILYVDQFAGATSAEIGQILNVLLLLRDIGFLGVPRSLFGPHSKVVIDKQRLNMNTPRDFINSFLLEAGKKLNIPQFSKDQLKYFEDVVTSLAPDGIIDDDKEEDVVIERPTKDQLGQWSLIALLILAMYTFPHESTTRYPGPTTKTATSKVNGCEDYNESLGIVSQLGRIGYLTMLALDALEPALETVAGFYPTVEASF